MTAESIHSWQDRAARVLLKNYSPRPIAFARGDGARLWDTTGAEYLDFCSGIAVTALGHANPDLTTAISEQAARLLHVSNLYLIPEQIELAEKLARFTGMDRFFFCNSGTEANEAAIKLARSWGKSRNRTQIIVARDGFHGRTLGSLSATAQPSMQEPFGPLLAGFVPVQFGEIASIEQCLDDQTAAVYLEPIQAEGGANIPPDRYLHAVRELCDRNGCLLVLDEVQTGIGRTGYPLAAHRSGIQPDVVALAKGLGGGVPIGALGIRDSLDDVLTGGTHGSTFGGNPLVCQAAAAVIDALSKDGVLDGVRAAGERLLAAVAQIGGPVTNPRGQGLFVAFDVPDSGQFVDAALAAGLLVVGAKNNAVRLLPPLNISDRDLDEGIQRLCTAASQLGDV